MSNQSLDVSKSSACTVPVPGYVNMLLLVGNRTNGVACKTLRIRAANLNSNSIELYVFAELELELDFMTHRIRVRKLCKSMRANKEQQGPTEFLNPLPTSERPIFRLCANSVNQPRLGQSVQQLQPRLFRAYALVTSSVTPRSLELELELLELKLELELKFDRVRTPIQDQILTNS